MTTGDGVEPAGRSPRRRALWVSTSRSTRGGMTSFVETVAATPLWERWQVRFVATHRPGPVPVLAVAFARGLAAFVRELLLRRPDVVHLHMAKNASYFRKAALLWLATAVRIPVVLHVHAGRFRLFYDAMPRPVRWSVRRTLCRAGAVVALGERWAERLREIAPGARVVAIPNPVVVPGSAPVPHHLGARDADSEPVRVVFLGRICADKGSFVLVQAWEKLLAGGTRVPVRLTLAGDGEVERARELVARRELGATVSVRSWLGPEEVAALLDTAHVLTLPSRNEGQPMAVLEAMARGIAVVATDVGGIPDLVEHGVSGVLVPPDDPDALADALRCVVDDAAARGRLGAAGLARVRETFDADVVWRRYERLYLELIGSSAGSGAAAGAGRAGPDGGPGGRG
ncbi:MAG TPA: glycosyltransferase [Pseudonocardia sp.]|nr:glycosyltransferase [Pseudonocardia sp.]